MSAEPMMWAKGVRAGGPNRKVILLLLAEYADEEWSCFPSQGRIAHEVELSERTVRSLLKQMEEAGLIRRERRNTHDGYRTSDRIWLNPGREADQPEPPAGRPPTGEPRHGLPASDDTAYRQPVAARNTQGEHPGRENTPRALSLLPPDARAAAAPRPSKRVIDEAFVEFWRVYPRRAGKGDARRRFGEAVAKVGIPVLLGAVHRYATDPNQPADQTKIPHPATWLHQERWADDPLPTRAPPAGNAGSSGAQALLAMAGGGRQAPRHATPPRGELT